MAISSLHVALLDSISLKITGPITTVEASSTSNIPGSDNIKASSAGSTSTSTTDEACLLSPAPTLPPSLILISI